MAPTLLIIPRLGQARALLALRLDFLNCFLHLTLVFKFRLHHCVFVFERLRLTSALHLRIAVFLVSVAARVPGEILLQALFLSCCEFLWRSRFLLLLMLGGELFDLLLGFLSIDALHFINFTLRVLMDVH